MLQQSVPTSSHALERRRVLKRRTAGGATEASPPVAGAAVSSRQQSDFTSRRIKLIKPNSSTPSLKSGLRSIAKRGSRPSCRATTAKIAKPAQLSRVVGSKRAGSMLKVGQGTPPQVQLRFMRQTRRSSSPRKTSTGTEPEQQAAAHSKRARSHASMRVTSAVPQPSTGHRLALARRIPSAGPATLKAMGAGAPLLIVSRLAPLAAPRHPVKSPHRQSPSRRHEGKQHLRAAGRATGTGPARVSTGASAQGSGPHGLNKTGSGREEGTAARESKLKNEAKASHKPSADALVAAQRIVRSMRAWLGRLRRPSEQVSALRNAVQFPAHPAVLELMGAGTLVHPLILRPAAQCMRNLRRLSLRGCESLQTAEAVPTIVRSFPLLELLDLSGCRLLRDAELIAIGGGLIRLRVLEVATCRRITGEGLKAFAEAVHTTPVLQPASSGQEHYEAVNDGDASHPVEDGASTTGAKAVAREQVLPASSGAGTDVYTKGSEHVLSRGVGDSTPEIEVRGSARDTVPVSGPRMVRKVTEIPEVEPALSKRLAPHGTSPKLTLGQRALQTSALRCLNLADCRGVDDAGVAALGRKLPGLRDLCLYGCLQLTGRCADGFGHLDCRLRRLNTAGVYKFGHEASSYLLQANPGLLLYNNPNEFDSSTRLAGGERWLL